MSDRTVFQLWKICSHHSHLAGTLSDVTSYRFIGGMQRHTNTRNYTHLDTVVGRKTVVDSSRKTYSRNNPSTGVNLTISGPVFRGQVIVNTDENYRRKLWIRRFQYCAFYWGSPTVDMTTSQVGDGSVAALAAALPESRCNDLNARC